MSCTNNRRSYSKLRKAKVTHSMESPLFLVLESPTPGIVVHSSDYLMRTDQPRPLLLWRKSRHPEDPGLHRLITPLIAVPFAYRQSRLRRSLLVIVGAGRVTLTRSNADWPRATTVCHSGRCDPILALLRWPIGQDR